MLEIKDNRKWLSFKLADKRGTKKIPLASSLTIQEMRQLVDIQKKPENDRGMAMFDFITALVEKYNAKGDADGFTAEACAALISAWNEASQTGEA